MPAAQRVIRKLPQKQSEAFDDRPATTHWMLAAWAALVTGVVVWLGGWDDPRLLHNAWCRLATLAGTWALLAWAAAAPRKWLAQRLRLGVAASLTIHTLLAMLLMAANLNFLLTPLKPDVNRVVAIEKVEVPRLVEVTQPSSKPQPMFEKPVPTNQLTQQKTAQQQLQAVAAATPATEPPELASQPIPRSIARREPRSALTHRAEDPGKRSRQAKSATLVAQAPAKVEPDAVKPAATLAKSPRPVQPDRQKLSDTSPAEVQDRTPAPQVAARRPDREKDQPAAAALAKRDRPTPSPARVKNPAPDTAKLAASSPTQRAENQPSQPQRQAVAVETPAVEIPIPVRQADRRRAPTKLDASKLANSKMRPNRQPTPAKATSTPEPSEAVAALAPKSRTREVSSSPAPRVLADSRGGTGSRGDGRNAIDDTAAAPTYNAPFAAAAARRNRSSQTERGPALTPNPASKVARGRASAEAPASSLVALPIPNAQVAGAERPQNTNASSSATLSPQFGNAALGDVTAAKGEATFDTGPLQITRERGSGRGAMGGRLAMTTPETRSGLGPRRATQSATSPTGAASAPAMPVAPTVAKNVQASAAGAASPAEDSRVASGPRETARSSALAELPSPADSASAASIPANQPSRSRATRGGSTQPDQTPGPSIAAATSSPAGGARSPRSALAAIDPVALALITPLAVDLNPSTPKPAPGETSREPTRRTQLPAEPGPGGTGTNVALDPGLPQRIARRQTPVLRMSPSRFANRTEGGQDLPRRRTRKPAPAFAARTGRVDAAPVTDPNDPRPKTEAAIELGLAFLAPLQQEDGSWSLDEFGELPINRNEVASMRADGAATGLVLLAFLGGGYDHFDDKYRATVQRGLDYLIAQQGPRGDIFPERDLPGAQVTRFYSHGIAALALCEAYGMTGDPALRQPAQRALDYIMATQHRTKGGWRYLEGKESDLSVTGWQVMALRSGELAGLRVNPTSYTRVQQFVARCREQDGPQARFRYNPFIAASAPQNKLHGRNPGTVMTSVGMLMSLYFGEKRDAASMQRGADHLLENLPTHGDSPKLATSSTIGNPRRDTYYWYYATQVMFHMGGDYWQRWHEHLHPLLVDQQTQEGPLAGSWNPLLPVPDRWGPQAGRLYVTCLNLLSLEVSYRHLPLYEMTGQ